MKKAIDIKNLNKYYGKFHALNDVSLSVYEGDIYGLIGKNGAGKTTLFKQILGLSNYQDGDVSILSSTSEDQLRKARKDIGFYINSTFFPYLSAKENLEYFRILKGIEDKDEVDRVLKIVELDKVNKKYKSFSMGMKQRLGIANAIMGNPKIVILDEPINGLDPQGIVDIRNLIKKLNKDYNMTLIVSSHILNELSLIATRFGMIDHGVLLKEITSDELQEQKDSIMIHTNKYDQTLKFLENNAVTTIINQNNENEIQVTTSLEADLLLKQLMQHDLGIEEFYFHKSSLEEFYFSLTEGGIK
ncbi:ABC transporter ATP-binding protein [Erysipelothrix urinaevulpis]|uniref:ABC transporter ATP-binding protein n=1 Tax=Erysipelothrix urinaevulpis TaxID=2683717 RepID=UPI00135B1A0E|nr:ABC transporter ATP-binding protein [Erysipelothrix urinaevulpis]